MEMIYVTPAAGARVRMPEKNSAVMPSEGAWVPRNVHYEHLLTCGDIRMVDPQPTLPTRDVVAQSAAPSITKTPHTSAKEK